MENSRTLGTYAKYAADYERRNNNDWKDNPQKMKKIDDAHRAFLLESLKSVNKSGKLFEVGSGYGRDGAFIRSLGYEIQVSDAVDSFVERLKKENFSPIKFNLITDDFDTQYDYILANAVLVHFTRNEVKNAIGKIYKALKPNGVFAFSVKQRMGGGESWESRQIGGSRYFSYWDNGEIKELIEDTGFSVLSIKRTGGIRACWLYIIVEKAKK